MSHHVTKDAELRASRAFEPNRIGTLSGFQEIHLIFEETEPRNASPSYLNAEKLLYTKNKIMLPSRRCSVVVAIANIDAAAVFATDAVMRSGRSFCCGCCCLLLLSNCLWCHHASPLNDRRRWWRCGLRCSHSRSDAGRVRWSNADDVA